jgi:ribosomal protein S18 acetylase RimI-like enzyme
MVGLWMKLALFHAGLDGFYEPSDDAAGNFETYLRQSMDSPNSRVLVCLEEDALLGYVLGSIELHPPVVRRRRYGFVDNLVVDEGERRRGAGSLLVSAMFEWFASHGLDRVELNVSAQNPAGLAFWRARGFEDFQHVMVRKVD